MSDILNQRKIIIEKELIYLFVTNVWNVPQFRSKENIYTVPAQQLNRILADPVQKINQFGTPS